MASGKSKVTAELSAATYHARLCLDQQVEEAAGISISEIFKTKGQASFRKMELEVLSGVNPGQMLLIDTGGGIVETPAAVSLLRANGCVIWLDCPWKTIRARLKNATPEDRPLIEELGWEGMEVLFRRRRALYAAAADFRIPADRDLKDVAQGAMLRSLAWQEQNRDQRLMDSPAGGKP
ncbi:MAG: shikimate kinase [bacterium]|nr:shikimate kinase [bacterium]